jgi:hypothetical protein
VCVCVQCLYVCNTSSQRNAHSQMMAESESDLEKITISIPAEGHGKLCFLGCKICVFGAARGPETIYHSALHLNHMRHAISWPSDKISVL